VLRHPFNWKRMSMAAALCYRHDGQRARLYFQARPGAYNDQSLIEFIRNLRRHFRGERVILLWDGLPSHRSRPMQEFLAKQRTWLQVERLPAYAPDLNPVEGLWANLKGRELANRCEQTIQAVEFYANIGVSRVSRSQDLLFAFLRHAKLAL
jgi:transposase